MTIRNVLVFPAGTEIGLEIANSLRFCKEVRLFGAGQDIPNHGRFAFADYYPLPAIHEDGWLEALVALCKQLSIDYVMPAYDDVIVALSRAADNIPATVITSPRDACEITRSKSATYRALANVVRVPRLYEESGAVGQFPVFVKPDRGQGSQGVALVKTRNALHAALASVPDSIISEYLPGAEYTVDCFSDRDRGVLFAKARSRRRIRNGISVNAVTEDLAEAHGIAERIGRALGMRGAWFFQLKRAVDGELTLLEVAPRIAGAMATHRVTGVNFPLLSIFEHERLPVEIIAHRGPVEIDRALVNRYRHSIAFNSLYVDLDDTLVVHGNVNTQLISLIYRCIGENKPVTLITRHAADLDATLQRFRLAGLFDKIVHLKHGESKADYITDADAIFVDDSFAERRAVHRRHGIPTFDCSMLEMLTQQSEFMNRTKND